MLTPAALQPVCRQEACVWVLATYNSRPDAHHVPRAAGDGPSWVIGARDSLDTDRPPGTTSAGSQQEP